jgi:FdhD protein
MTTPSSYHRHHIRHRPNGAGGPDTLNLIAEEPLSIRVQGKPYSVIMRTPGGETDHAAGFCLAEGIIDSPEDLISIACCDGGDTNVVTVTLTAARRRQIGPVLERRGFVSQTSCGICGKELIDDLQQQIPPLGSGPLVAAGRALAAIDRLSACQPLRKETFASHAAALYDADLELLAAAEDVGRHNALDKAVGKLFLAHRLADARLLVLSSRASYELIQKAGRARIPIVLSVSRPTTLAVNLAARLNMTLACLSREGDLYVFCGDERFAD